jgi:hypothetical protein
MSGRGSFWNFTGMSRTRLKTWAASGFVNSLPAISSSLPMNSFGALESKGGKSSNIVGCDRLVGLVRADGVSQLAFEDSDFDLISSMPRLWAQMPRRALANGWLAVTKVI